MNTNLDNSNYDGQIASMGQVRTVNTMLAHTIMIHASNDVHSIHIKLKITENWTNLLVDKMKEIGLRYQNA